MMTRRHLLKKFCGLSLIGLFSIYFSASFSHTPQPTGFYVSGGLGAGWSGADQAQFTETATTTLGTFTTFGVSNAVDASGVAASVAVGYTLPYFSIEENFTHAPNYTENDTGQINLNGAFFGFLNSNDKNSLNYFNTVGMFTLPIYYFHLVAGGGLSIVLKRAHSRNSTVLSNGAVISTTTQAAESNTFYRPEIVVGVGRNITNHIICRVIYTRVFGKRNIGVFDAAKNFLPDINTLSLVVSYVI